MREGPILFQGDMVSAILKDQKSMTRRVIKPQPVLSPNAGFGQYHHGQMWMYGTYSNGVPNVRNFVASRSPYGQPGDLRWVRESVRAEESREGLDGVRYLADDAFRPIDDTEEAASKWLDLYSYRGGTGLVVPTIHMSRWASRITLRVTDVRVERVQDISVEDAFAEGSLWADIDHVGDMTFDMSKIAFELLWNSINAKPKRSSHNPYTGVLEHCYVSYPWENVTETLEHNKFPWYVIGNPWVWVVSFERLK